MASAEQVPEQARGLPSERSHRTGLGAFARRRGAFCREKSPMTRAFRRTGGNLVIRK